MVEGEGMGTAKATIRAGICGFTTTASATADDAYDVTYDIATDCPRIESLAAAIGQSGSVNALAELGLRHDATVLALARDRKLGVCVGCVVPPGLYKAMQVAAALALPADSQIAIVEDPA
jgi:hypothetical protein